MTCIDVLKRPVSRCRAVGIELPNVLRHGLSEKPALIFHFRALHDRGWDRASTQKGVDYRANLMYYEVTGRRYP